MATLSKLTPGQVVYSVERRRMGNTTMNTTSVFHVHILEVHEKYVVARWNGNAPEKFCLREIAKLKVKKPVLVKIGWGYRLATKDEIKAMS